MSTLTALLIALSAPAPAATPGEVGLDGYRALLIGVNDYRDSGIADLQTPEQDVRALRSLLRGQYGFGDVTTLTGASATREGIIDALYALRKTDPDEAVLIYFAGHGVQDAGNEQGYWLPVDARRDSNSRWISNADVSDAVKALPARHVLLISDACFSGSLVGTRDLGSAHLPADLAAARRLADKKSRWVVASGGDEPVVDSHLGSEHSVFAHFLLQTLEDQDRPFVNTGAFFDSLKKQVINNAHQTPIAAPLRMAGDEGGEFVFANARIDSSAVAEADPPGFGGGPGDGHIMEMGLQSSSSGEGSARIQVNIRDKYGSINGDQTIQCVMEGAGGLFMTSQMTLRGADFLEVVFPDSFSFAADAPAGSYAMWCKLAGRDDLRLGTYGYKAEAAEPLDSSRDQRSAGGAAVRVDPGALPEDDSYVGKLVDLGWQSGYSDDREGGVSLDYEMDGYFFRVLRGDRLEKKKSGDGYSYRVVAIYNGCAYAGQGYSVCLLETSR